MIDTSQQFYYIFHWQKNIAPAISFRVNSLLKIEGPLQNWNCWCCAENKCNVSLFMHSWLNEHSTFYRWVISAFLLLFKNGGNNGVIV